MQSGTSNLAKSLQRIKGDMYDNIKYWYLQPRPLLSPPADPNCQVYLFEKWAETSKEYLIVEDLE